MGEGVDAVYRAEGWITSGMGIESSPQICLHQGGRMQHLSVDVPLIARIGSDWPAATGIQFTEMVLAA